MTGVLPDDVALDVERLAAWGQPQPTRQLDELLAFIRDHGMRAVVDGDQLLCELVTTGPLPGQVNRRWEPVAPTVRAVRDWLGY